MLSCDEIRDLAPAFVLGALERDEEAAVTEHLLACPDVHREVAELGEMTAYLDETIPLVEPPASLRGRILAAAADELAARQAANAPAPPATAPAPKPAAASAPRPAALTTAPRETSDRVISLDQA